MNEIAKGIEIKEIPIGAKYTGYIWLSNVPNPIEYHDQNIDVLCDNNDNPFIVEGHLFADNISYSIKYIDGKHHVIRFDLKAISTNWISDENEDLKKYIPNRLKVKKILFRQYWEPIKDEFCLNNELKTLVPIAHVFIGFEKNDKYE